MRDIEATLQPSAIERLIYALVFLAGLLAISQLQAGRWAIVVALVCWGMLLAVFVYRRTIRKRGLVRVIESRLSDRLWRVGYDDGTVVHGVQRYFRVYPFVLLLALEVDGRRKKQVVTVYRDAADADAFRRLAMIARLMAS